MMPALANLRREERISLGIAAAAHLLRFATMALYDNQRAPMPVPERMEVSLADEISLQSTAPDPTASPRASVAPEIAAETTPPEPVEVQPATQQPQPSVQPRVEPRPQPPVTQRTPPRPAETKRPTGTRIGTDFLEGSGTSTSRDRTGSTASAFGPAEQASLASAINRQLKEFWSAPSGVDSELLVTVLTWEMNEDGSLKGSPRVVSQSGINDSNRPQAALHAERAMRAVQLAAPFDLPPQFYDKWRRVREWRFDRKL